MLNEINKTMDFIQHSKKLLNKTTQKGNGNWLLWETIINLEYLLQTLDDHLSFFFCCCDKILGFFSQFQITVHHGREVIAAKTWENWSHYIHRQEKKAINTSMAVLSLPSPFHTVLDPKMGLPMSISNQDYPSQTFSKINLNLNRCTQMFVSSVLGWQF